MTHDDAVEAARKLQAEHPDRATHGWMAHERGDGEWIVVKVAMPPGARVDPLKVTIESKPAPPPPEDPRPLHDRNVGGPYGPA